MHAKLFLQRNFLEKPREYITKYLGWTDSKNKIKSNKYMPVTVVNVTNKFTNDCIRIKQKFACYFCFGRVFLLLYLFYRKHTCV